MALTGVLLLGNALFQNVALEPVITAPLLYLLLRKPQVFQQHVLQRFPKIESSTLVATLKWLVALGIGGKLNQLLNNWARNNWQLKTRGSTWEWDKEIAVVTGGCSGFGERVAQGLAKKGLKVVILDVQDLPESLKSFSNITFHKCDITSPEAVSDVANTIRSETGHPSILINNAGIGDGGTILERSNESLRKIFDVNIISHFFLIKEFLPNMVKENKGHIVTVASMASFTTCCNIVDYCCTKAGVLALHEGLSQELKHRYDAPLVKTSIVHPIWAKTPLISSWESSLQKAKAPVLSADTVGDAIVKQVLSGRSGQVFCPPVMGVAAAMKGWPNWLQENIRDGQAKFTGDKVKKVK